MGRDDLIPLVAVVGPTAVGKTDLAVTFGPEVQAEVISADSRQFYRMMDIGTAKPTPAELAVVPHHLIDIADPDETVGLARFLRLARAAIDEVHARGKVPFVVGGTGQYVRGLLKGWRVPEIPPDPDLRATLERQAEADPEALWERLMALDPDAAEFIHPHNLRRVIRALEVCLKSGRPFSEQRRRQPPPYRVLQLGLTMEREALYARADARVEVMMAAGLLQEVTQLLDAGYGWELPAMSGLGYIQFQPYFEGEATLEEVVERIQLDTHDFIRRQYTWFRPNSPKIRWFDVQPLDLDEIRETLTRFLEEGPVTEP
jgi:tRNA dimethylallyltransferase